MIIEIDNHSGFCFGVTRAIQKTEELLSSGINLTCLGEIVHNQEEVQRLSSMGMKSTEQSSISTLKNETVLIRTHGEPPSTYKKLRQNGNAIVDATCPVVLKLQDRIRKSFEKQRAQNGQLVIFGKPGHAEVIGLMGQTGNGAILIHSETDIEKIDFARPIEIFSQTTMPVDVFEQICNEIEKRAKSSFEKHDTICRQVSNRVPYLKDFSSKYDVILFVSGKNSSNGKALFDVCRKTNPSTHFVVSPGDIELDWFSGVQRVGICGATSTPQWLMEQVKNHVRSILNL